MLSSKTLNAAVPQLLQHVLCMNNMTEHTAASQLYSSAVASLELLSSLLQLLDKTLVLPKATAADCTHLGSLCQTICAALIDGRGKARTCALLCSFLGCHGCRDAALC